MATSVAESRAGEITTAAERVLPGGSAGRSEDFGRFLLDLYDELGRALEADDLDWCAVLDGLLISRVEAEFLAAEGEAPRRR